MLVKIAGSHTEMEAKRKGVKEKSTSKEVVVRTKKSKKVFKVVSDSEKQGQQEAKCKDAKTHRAKQYIL